MTDFARVHPHNPYYFREAVDSNRAQSSCMHAKNFGTDKKWGDHACEIYSNVSISTSVVCINVLITYINNACSWQVL